MQRFLVSGRTAAPASTTTRQAAHWTLTRVVRAAELSLSDSPSSSLPLLSPTRREALSLGAASLALGLASGLVSSPAARAEEGGEWKLDADEGREGERESRRRSSSSATDRKTAGRRPTPTLPTSGKKKRKPNPPKNRIHDPLRHRLAADVVRRLRRQRGGGGQVSFFCLDLFRVERGERGERTETKKPDLEENRKQKTHFLLSSFFFLLLPSLFDSSVTSGLGTPSSTPRAGSPRRSGSSRRGWSGSTRR
jgi:hypothetical protein